MPRCPSRSGSTTGAQNDRVQVRAICTLTALVAGAGVTAKATASTALAAWGLGAAVGGPDPPPATRARVPDPVALNGGPDGGGYDGAA